MTRRFFSFFAPPAVLSAWGVVMLHTVATGHINRLLNPMFRGYVLAAAISLLLLAAIYLWLYQPAPPAASVPDRGPWRGLVRWLVLLVPVVAAAILSPDALSSTTMANRANLGTLGALPMPSMSAATAENVKAAMAADPNQPVPVDVTDLITLSKSPEQMKSFAGRKVRAIGFIIPQASGSPKLLRWMMWCCAADAQPVSVALKGDFPGTYKDDQWFEIVGTAQFPSTMGQVVPEIDVDSIKPTQEPDEPYLSP
jgi:uncharacterized repeat protein (TIGR03943 family)